MCLGGGKFFFAYDVETEIEEQSAETAREELEQTCETAQIEEEKNERSEEQLNVFSQEAEEAATLKLTAKAEVEDEEEDDDHSEEWLNIFIHEAEKNATEEVAEEEEEGVDSICFADLWDQIEALEE
jgi:hypothetical protein